MQAVLASDLKPAGVRIVAMVLAWHANEDSGHAWPSLATIAAESGVSRDRVKQVVRLLVDQAVLEIVAKGTGGGRNQTTRYAFCTAWVGKWATRVAGSPGKSERSDPGSPLPLPGEPASPKRNERSSVSTRQNSLSLKERGSTSSAGSRAGSARPPAESRAHGRRNKPEPLNAAVIDYHAEVTP